MTEQKITSTKSDEDKGRLNKIFLFFTTLFTLIIAGAQSYIAYKQYEASKLSFSPIFVFQEELVKRDGSERYDNENLKIINMGYPINNYSSKEKIFIKATQTIIKEKVIKESILIPVNYYAASYSSTGGKDTLETFIGMDNNTDVVSLRWSVNALDPKGVSSGPFYDIDLIKAFELTYSDIEGIEHKKYFINQKPVDNKLFLSMTDDAENIVPPRDIRNLDAGTIVSLLQKSYKN